MLDVGLLIVIHFLKNHKYVRKNIIEKFGTTFFFFFREFPKVLQI